MVRSVQHDMLPQSTHDDVARQQFVVALKQGLNRSIRSSNKRLFEEVVAPEFAARTGATPDDRDTIRGAMYSHPAYRGWSTMHRSAQELMWTSVADVVARDTERLQQQAARLTQPAKRRGSLELDPSVQAPRGVANLDIHLQTGGYMMNRSPEDVAAGALYEVGGNLYAFGQGLGKHDSKAAHVQRFLAEKFPDLKPERILDMGCSAGSASVPYALEFPDAEVHAIDVAPAMLRYAHARAESLAAAVHFHQRDAADTKFPDSYFDLIVSHNMMHEIPDSTRRGMLKESWRMLAPGGVAVHQDVPLQFKGLSEFQKFEMSWDTLNNNEPYWEVYASADLAADAKAAGIPDAQVYVGNLPQATQSLPWFVTVITKPAA
ncbi:MAG: class I SAM-dependent methyltransferase [Pseudomonadales bacterium]|nr:class I SAM-dependent methyltransferase [Pseudomonadales bacterium]